MALDVFACMLFFMDLDVFACILNASCTIWIVSRFISFIDSHQIVTQEFLGQDHPRSTMRHTKLIDPKL
jgi:hypothetical protein